MRILFILPNALIGGAEKQTARLIFELASKGFSPSVIFLGVGGPLIEELNGVEHYVLNLKGNMRNFRDYLKSIVYVARIFRSGNFALIHAQLAPSITFSWICKLVFNAKAPLICGVRGEMPRKNFFSEWCLKLALRDSDRVVFNSLSILALHSKRFKLKKEKCSYIPNGVDTTPKNLSKGGNLDLVFIVVSNLIQYKNIETALLAFSVAKIENSRLVICGEGPNKMKLIELAEQLEITDFVSFEGFAKDVSKYLERSQIAIHPSLTEGMSNAILEELSFGLPILASDIDSNREILESGTNALFFSPKNHLQLAQLMQFLSKNSQLRNRMKRNNLDKAKNYAWDSCTARYLEVYRSVFKG